MSDGPARVSSAAARLDHLVESYELLPGTLDECFDPRGRMRPHWRRFFEAFTAIPAADLDRRFASADRHMRDTGIFFRAYGETDERPWPLSHVPLLIDGEEWQAIASGVIQRARLAEAILADIHGPNQLVEGGHLPAAAVAGSPDYLHPMQGVVPAGGRHLSLYAVDLGRGPDGRWRVLGDRTQAPSGAGYALENRLALSRAFADLYGAMNVERLAPFFESFRSGLAAMAERVEPRICLLTRGPMSETYFEHAYLARYLGFLLVEGGDLVVRDDQVHVRTIAGLKRADVLLRRIDGDFADPLELNPTSHLGVPGLMQAIRAGSVVTANALGAGLIESRAVMAVMPALSRTLLGEKLALSSVATTWCGTEAGRAFAAEHLDDSVLAGAFRERTPELDRATLGSDLGADRRERLLGLMPERGIDYALQDVARLSTMPVWDGRSFVPRLFVLRVFAAATPSGWRVMPGGFCRIAMQPDNRSMAMAAGVQSADVWVLSDAPVEASSLMLSGPAIRIRRTLGNLPSRAADNLFWLGRYLERTEATLRVVRCLCGRLIEAGAADADAGVIDKLRGVLATRGATPDGRADAGTRLLWHALHDRTQFGSAHHLAREVKRTASVIRERLSGDTTHLIDSLVALLGTQGPEAGSETDLLEEASQAIRLVSAVSGLSQENMNRVAGWRFLEMGRRIERGVETARFARLFAGNEAAASDLDALLDLIDSQITYRSRYLVGVALAPVRDMTLLDPFNPRSVAFQVERLAEHIAALPLMREDGLPEVPSRLARTLAAKVATADAAELGAAAIAELETDLLSLGTAISDRYFLQGATAARADKFGGLE